LFCCGRRWIRKPALGERPVDGRNRRGFPAGKRIHTTVVLNKCLGDRLLEGGFESRLLAGCRWQIQRVERVAAVGKIEEKRKPGDCFGYRNGDFPWLEVSVY